MGAGRGSSSARCSQAPGSRLRPDPRSRADCGGRPPLGGGAFRHNLNTWCPAPAGPAPPAVGARVRAAGCGPGGRGILPDQPPLLSDNLSTRVYSCLTPVPAEDIRGHSAPGHSARTAKLAGVIPRLQTRVPAAPTIVPDSLPVTRLAVPGEAGSGRALQALPIVQTLSEGKPRGEVASPLGEKRTQSAGKPPGSRRETSPAPQRRRKTAWPERPCLCPRRAEASRKLLWRARTESAPPPDPERSGLPDRRPASLSSLLLPFLPSFPSFSPLHPQPRRATRLGQSRRPREGFGVAAGLAAQLLGEDAKGTGLLASRSLGPPWLVTSDPCGWRDPDGAMGNRVPVPAAGATLRTTWYVEPGREFTRLPLSSTRDPAGISAADSGVVPAGGPGGNRDEGGLRVTAGMLFCWWPEPPESWTLASGPLTPASLPSVHGASRPRDFSSIRRARVFRA
ncbi:uncharacterized protein LOC144581662 [Callithrix jacchus]